MKNLIAAVILTAAFIGQAFAGTITTNFQTGATLSSACSIAANDINFGDITPLSSNDGNLVVESATDSLSVTCSNGLAYTIEMGVGLHSPNNTLRYLTNESSSDQINYSICQTADYSVGGGSTGWSCTVPFRTDVWPLHGTGNGTNQIIPFYPHLKNGYFQPGVYSDTLTVTILY